MTEPVRTSPPVELGPRFVEALSMALELHGDQTRKGRLTPYVSHLLAVAALVLENGGDEDEAVAALLHDGPEDRGGHETLKRIRDRFGARVADIVKGCSDTLEKPKPEWRPRKERYVAHLRAASSSVRLVAAADKVHNLSGLLADARAEGPETFRRFNSSPQEQVWYYRACARALLEGQRSPLAPRIAALAEELESLVREAF